MDRLKNIRKPRKAVLGLGLVLGLVGLLLSASGSRGGEIKGQVHLNGVKKENAAVHLIGLKKTVKPPAKGAVMVQKNQLFIPAVLPVVKGTEVILPNKDTVFHNAFSMSKGNSFDLGQYGPGKKPRVVFKEPGLADIFCNMHEQMHAAVVVLEHPYHALTNKKGEFSIPNVPEGVYQIKAWIGPRFSKEVSVTVPSGGAVEVLFDLKK